MNSIKINGEAWEHQALDGLTITEGKPFAQRIRHRPVDAVVLHEPAGVNPERTLRRKGYGCHFIVHGDGAVVQHNDLARRVVHGGAMNDRSVGIEIINPYYGPPKDLWIDEIKAPWAHKGRYLVPTLAQLEATAVLLDALTSCCVEGVEIPRAWPGYSDGVLEMGADKNAWDRPGIAAHIYEGRHADGSFPVLYCWLRMEGGLSPQVARATAMDLATKRRAQVGGVV